MQQQFSNNQPQGMQNLNPNTATPVNLNRGAHELFDTHEVLSGMIGTLNNYLMFEQHIKDPELMDILHRQRQFITDQYNITVECFKAGDDPSHPTATYQMNQSNEVLFGLTPSQPRKPNQDISQLGDRCISSLMMTCMKNDASCMTMAAAESTNPVVRRVLADSIPNYLEMAYEIFLYQNKKGYYQVPQLNDQDMIQMMNSYAPINGNQTLNQNSNIIQ
jgi:spore coat protein CotF